MMNDSRYHGRDICYYALGLAATLFHAWIISQHALNIPKWDDYTNILQFMDAWLKAGNISERLRAFTSHINEHILLVNHAIILAQYYLTGTIHFAWLMAIGNLLYIGSAIALWYFFHNHKESAWIFCIIMLTCVSFQPYDSLLWAMTAISNQAVIFFSLITIHCVNQSKIRSAMVFATLAIFSQANGLLMIPLVAIWLYRQQGLSRTLKTWLVYSGMAISLYGFCFWYGSIYHLTYTTDILSLKNLLLLPLSFVATFGALAFPDPQLVFILLSAITGTLILLLTLQQLRQQLYKPWQLAILAFIFISIIFLVGTRGLAQGPAVAFVSRYKMYAAGFLAMAILTSPLILEKISAGTAWRHGIIAFCMSLYISAFAINIPQARLIDSHLYQSLQHWVEDGDLRRAKGYFVHDADSYLFAALENKSWSPMALIDPEQIIQVVQTATACDIDTQRAEALDITFIKHKNRNAAGIRIDPVRDQSAPAVKLWLCSDGDQHYHIDIPARAGAKPEADPMFYYIPRESVQPGSYTVYLIEGERIIRQSNPFIKKKNTR